jgi:hypothetical protein
VVEYDEGVAAAQGGHAVPRRSGRRPAEQASERAQRLRDRPIADDEQPRRGPVRAGQHTAAARQLGAHHLGGTAPEQPPRLVGVVGRVRGKPGAAQLGFDQLGDQSDRLAGGEQPPRRLGDLSGRLDQDGHPATARQSRGPGGAQRHIAPGSDQPMRRTDRTGRQCHWILEIHLVDRARGFGGFYEQLLDL